MSIPAETLNAMLVTSEVRTGVYADHQRHTCVVIKVTKEGVVHMLHFRDSTVQLEASFREKFLRDYPVQFYHYPAVRAVRKLRQYVLDGFRVTDEARIAINAILIR